MYNIKRKHIIFTIYPCNYSVGPDSKLLKSKMVLSTCWRNVHTYTYKKSKRRGELGISQKYFSIINKVTKEKMFQTPGTDCTQKYYAHHN